MSAQKRPLGPLKAEGALGERIGFSQGICLYTNEFERLFLYGLEWRQQ